MKKENTGIKKTVIIGIGNDLMMDDGIGLRILDRVIEWLGKNSTDAVDIVYGNTDPRVIWTELEGRENIILLDAISLGNKPGTVYRFGGEDFYKFLREHASHGAFHAHDISIFDTIIHSEISGMKFGQITLIGIEPKSIELGMKLTPEAEESLDEAVKMVKDTLRMYEVIS